MLKIPSSLTLVGDAEDPSVWSGTSYHLLRAARRVGWDIRGWRFDLGDHARRSRLWNLRRVLTLHRPGGYQYSEEFLNRLEDSVPSANWGTDILSLSQHFPRARTVSSRGGRLFHYVDASLTSFFKEGGLESRLPADVREAACRLQFENFIGSERVVTMARWAAGEIIETGIPSHKVSTLLPGANLELPADFELSSPQGRPGYDRPLVLGFIGKDWKRKGLDRLLSVRDYLEKMNLKAEVHAAGTCPDELRSRKGLHFAGFLDKRKNLLGFLSFLGACDLGCLFSQHEPLGLSTLEFLRAGVPVAGLMNEGICDTVPPDAGFRLEPTLSDPEIAEVLRDGFSDEAVVERRREYARRASSLVTWERCVAEWGELFATGTVANPVQLWKGVGP